MINSHLVKPQESSGGLTELVLTENSPNQQGWILSMIRHLSGQEDGRWLTWITADPRAARLLQDAGIDSQTVRLVHCSSDDHLWVSWEALTLGNSHTVIASPGKLSAKSFQALETAAIAGNCQAILLRTRHTSTVTTEAPKPLLKARASQARTSQIKG